MGIRMVIIPWKIGDMPVLMLCPVPTYDNHLLLYPGLEHWSILSLRTAYVRTCYAKVLVC